MRRSAVRVILAWLTVAVVSAWSIAPGAAQGPASGNGERLLGGHGTLYLGGYPNLIWIIDEATERITGTIELQTGIPRRAVLSRDLARFYVTDATGEHVEIVDIASRRTLDTFTLSEGSRKVRISSMAPDPQHRSLILLTRAATKHIDRFEIGPSTLLQYDLQRRQVVRTVPWPDGRERDSANLLFSPDGQLLYFLGNEILIFETENFTEVDRWEMSNLEEGLGQVSVSFGGFGGVDTTNDEPGFFTTTLTIQDPVQNRRMMGIARINLIQKSVDFYTLGPAGGISFALAPGLKRGYGLLSEIGRYEFWTFDLEHRRILSRTEFEGRPRMSMKTSSNGQLLYIFNAGNTIDIYEAATYQHLRTMTFDGDMTTTLFVVPPGAITP